MTLDETRRVVLAAIAAGRIPGGGPSELRALNLADDVPDGYWQRWGRDAAARIRASIGSEEADS